MKWKPAVRKAIRESLSFVALLSKTSSKKQRYRHSELKQAIEILDELPDDKIYLIPTRLEECEPPVEMLRDVTYADLFPDWDCGVRRLKKALGIKTTSASAASPKKSNKWTHR